MEDQMRQRHLIAGLLCFAFFLLVTFVSVSSPHASPATPALLTAPVLLASGDTAPDAGAVALPAPTVPATAPTQPTDAPSVIRDAYDAIVHGNWFLAAGVLLVGAGMVVNFLLAKGWSVFKKDRVKMGIVAVLAGAGAFMHAWVAAAPPDLDTVTGAIKVFVAAVFTYMAAKKVKNPDGGVSAARAAVR
jgi:hypothetical protein